MNVDYILDRRRLKRSLIYWRILGITAVILTGLALMVRLDGFPSDPHVARLMVDGLIIDDKERNEILMDLVADEDARALIIHIDSPGGTFAGGEKLYRGLRRIAKTKPIVAVMGNTGTSAAYMAAIGAEQIFALEGTITGSIGVIMQTADVTGLLNKLGIKPETVKSDAMKAQPNPIEPFSKEARVMMQDVIKDLHETFVKLVSERRSIPLDEARKLSNGKIFTGHQAVSARLIDSIGDEFDARKWLEEHAGVSLKYPVTDITPHNKIGSWDQIFSYIFGRVLFSERHRLDGILALWQPQFIE